jgi:hypothetical protein
MNRQFQAASLFSSFILHPSSFLLVVLGVAGGCGTTRITDTLRTGTEQLLISNAIDRSVSELDFQCLAGKSVYFDPQYLEGVVDRGYLISSLRQHLLATGCRLQEERTKATYVVEIRSGGVGTDRHALLVGVPQMNVPTLVPGQPAQIPEIPLAKKTDQQGIAKIAVFAYNRLTGQPVWQSGVVQAVSTSKDTWLLGAGPFQQGTIFKETQFAGQPLSFPHLTGKAESDSEVAAGVPVTEAASWTEAFSGPMALTQPSSLPSLVPAGGPLRIGPTDRLVLDLVGGGAPPAPTQVSVGSLPVASEPSAPAKPPASESKSSSAAAPNSGGQEETQPNKIFSSGFGALPGASSDSGTSHAASGSGGKKKPPGS